MHQIARAPSDAAHLLSSCVTSIQYLAVPWGSPLRLVGTHAFITLPEL